MRKFRSGVVHAMTFALAATAPLLGIGCGLRGSSDDGAEKPASGSTQQPLAIVKDVKWPLDPQSGQYVIPMCWDLPHFSLAGTVDTSQLRARVETLVHHFWEQNLNLRVTWELCPPFPVTPGPNVKNHVRAWLTNGPGAGVANTGIQALSPDTDPHVSLAANPGFIVEAGAAMDHVSQAVVLHEFGHILGFDHEFVRGDRYGSCPDELGNPWLGADAGEIAQWNAAWDAGATLPVTQHYDPLSIMNSTYCNSVDEPSLSDIQGARSLYGTPSDFDQDGLLGTADNCPYTYNPNQQNCNLEFEDAKAARSGEFVERLGDACDPVPCPNTGAFIGYKSGSSFNGYACTSSDPETSFYRDHLDELWIQPIGSHVRQPSPPIGAGTPNPVTEIANVPTKLRFCQDSRTRGVFCSSASALANVHLREERTAEQITASSPDHPWHRITLRESQFGTARDRNDNVGYPLLYGNPTPDKRLFWDFQEDAAFWRRARLTPPFNQLNVLGVDDKGPACSKESLFGPGTCLDGYVWTSAGTDFGSTVGGDRTELANHVFPLAPDPPRLQVCVPQRGSPSGLPPFDPCFISPDGCVGKVFVRPTDCIECSLHLVNFARDEIVFPIFRTEHGPAAAIFKDALFDIATFDLNVDAQGVDLSERLSRRNFVTAVEYQAPQIGEIDAVALPFDLSLDHEFLTAAPNGFEWGSMSALASKSSPSASDFDEDARETPDGLQRAYGRINPKVVFSRTRGEIYVVGGRDWATGALAQSVLVQTVGSSNQYLLQGAIEADVLAATWTPYGSPFGSLWTVERDELGGVHFVVRPIGPYDGNTLASPIVQVELESSPDDGYRLAQSSGGADNVLLTVNNYSERHWGLFSVVAGVAGITDVSFSPLVAGDAFEEQSFLFEAPHVSGSALVLPMLRPDSTVGETFWIEWFIPREAHPAVDPMQLRSWVR